MKSSSEGVILPSNYDTKVSASNLKREVSGKYLSMTTSKSTKVKIPPLICKQKDLVERIRDNSASKKKIKASSGVRVLFKRRSVFQILCNLNKQQF